MEKERNEARDTKNSIPQNHPDFKGDPVSNSSRYSFPDKRERKDGPGGDGQ